jgi:hypothetical protein
MSNEKMSAKERTTEEAAEILETELRPENETPVPTGDEEQPVAAPDPMEARKQLYEKARKRRKETVSREAEEHVDVELLQAMQEEASGGDKPESEVDTNRKDRSDEERAIAEAMGEEEQSEEENTNLTSDSAEPSLTKASPEDKVAVKILGKEYLVPQQDIDDAGGIELYQKSRAVNLKLQRIATLEKALPAEPDNEAAHGEQQETDPSTDGLGEADIASLREEVVDAMVEGEDMSALDEVLKKALTKTTPTIKNPRPAQPNEISVTERQIIEDAKRELLEQMEADRVATNDMMRQEYSDIMGDQELLQLAQQRFAVLGSDPSNEGRTQKELARESAEFVRSLGKRLLVEKPATSQVEQERQQRIQRKKRLPRASRADAPAAPVSQERKPMSNREYLARLRKMQGHDLAE